MGKGTKKPRKFNAEVLKRIKEKFGLSEYYIRECLNGHNTSETADTIRKEYNRLLTAVQTALNS